MSTMQAWLEWEVSFVLHIKHAEVSTADDVPTLQEDGPSVMTTVLQILQGLFPHPQTIPGKHPVERFQSTFWN